METATLDMLTLTDVEIHIICNFINIFGDGKHPVADSQNINGFTISYLKRIMNGERFMTATTGLPKDERLLINNLYKKLK